MHSFTAGLAVVLLASSAAVARSATVPEIVQQDQVPLQVRAVSMSDDGTVDATIANPTADTLRNLRLRVRYSWHWHRETRPGEDTMSFTDVHAVDELLEPGQETRITHRPSRELSASPEGSYTAFVTIAGYSRIVERVEAIP